jgi:hypothetical protein
MQPAIRRCIDQRSMARVMTLDADDFISRLVPHELPKAVP